MDYSLSEVRWTIPVYKHFINKFFEEDLYTTLEADNVNVFFNSYDIINKKNAEAPLYGDGLIQMKITPGGTYNTRVLCERIDGLKVDVKRIRPIDEKSFFVFAGRLLKEKVAIIRP